MAQHRKLTYSATDQVTVDGVTRTWSEWADHLGVTVTGLLSRVRYRGMTPEAAIRKPFMGAGKRKQPKHVIKDSNLPWEESHWSWYVVTCHPEGLTLGEVAQLFGVTRERIRQIEAKALAKLASNKEHRVMLRDLLEHSVERAGNRSASSDHMSKTVSSDWVRSGRYEASERGKKLMDHGERVTVDGVTRTVLEWSKLLGLSAHAICMRVGSGWTKEEACRYAKGKGPNRGQKSRRLGARPRSMKNKP